MSKAPFAINPELTGIAIAYKNNAMIADAVLPRFGVGVQDYKFTRYTISDTYSIPNTLIGRKGQAKRVEFGGTEDTGSCKDFGLEDAVPLADVMNAPKGANPLTRATMQLQDLIALDREVRVAALVHGASTYGSSNKITLSGTDQFSDDASDPIGVIGDAIDVPLVRPNIMVMGRTAWTKLRRNPKIVKAANKNDGDSGMASRQAVADLFELDELLIGEGFMNSAKPGQAPVNVRVWGKHIALLNRNPLATNQNGVTFGWTAQFGDRVAMTREDGDIGLRGGTVIKTGESVDEKIVAPDLGYLIINAVA